MLDSYVHGFALQAAGLPFDTADEPADMAEEFVFGLDLVLAALEPLRTSA